LKLCLQLVEHLYFRIVKVEHSAILIECGCCGQDTKEPIGRARHMCLRVGQHFVAYS